MRKFSKKEIIEFIILIVVVLAVGGGSFYFGYRSGYRKGSSTPQTLGVTGITNRDQGRVEGVDFGTFWDAWKLLKDRYVDADSLTSQNLLYGAISGLFTATKDPYTVFFPPSDAQAFNENISGEFSGIGAEIGSKNDQLLVVAPLKDTPAERAGLRAGDRILKIDGKDTTNLSVDGAVKLIRGPKGTMVTLTILRNGWSATKDVLIKRDTIKVPTLDFKMINSATGKEAMDGSGDVAYIRLYNFFENTPYIFYQTAIKMALKNPKGIILDLRDNPGGYLEVAETLEGWFVNPGDIVVRERYRSGNEDVFKASGNGLFKNIPIVVLINQGSASASEILAGALRDDRGTKLIGKKSFGKGTVQEIDNLKDNSLVKITIAHWLLPGGQLIDKNGINPDYDVDLTDDDIKAGRDPQLDKAIQVMKGEIPSEGQGFNP